VETRAAAGPVSPGTWDKVLPEIGAKLAAIPHGTSAFIASARQTNEELYLISLLAKKLGAMTDSIPRTGESDKLLLSSDRNPNSAGARLTRVAAEPMGSNLPKIVEGIRSGRIRNLIVFGEDVTRHGISPELLGKLDLLVVSDILPNETVRRAGYLLPGAAHLEKRGSFTNGKGRVQKFMKGIEPRGDARPEWEILRGLCIHAGLPAEFKSIEGLFNQMAAAVPAFSGLSWATLGDTGVTVPL
jgi:NADH-quinone oxidoreductase subunit G